VTVAKAAAMVKAGDARDARGCGVVSGEKNVAGFVRALVSVGLSAINYSITFGCRDIDSVLLYI
jgi:hypothetical protein